MAINDVIEIIYPLVKETLPKAIKALRKGEKKIPIYKGTDWLDVIYDEIYDEEDNPIALFSSDSESITIPSTIEPSKVAHELAHAYLWFEYGEESTTSKDDKEYLSKPGEKIAHIIQACFGPASVISYVNSIYYFYGMKDIGDKALTFAEKYNSKEFEKFSKGNYTEGDKEDYFEIGEEDFFFEKMKYDNVCAEIMREASSKVEYDKLLGQHAHDNSRYLAEGDFDSKMDEDERFMRGFYHWSEDSHNWGAEIAPDTYLVVSYATDEHEVGVSIVRGRSVVQRTFVRGLDYDKVMSASHELSTPYDDYGMF